MTFDKKYAGFWVCMLVLLGTVLKWRFYYLYKSRHDAETMRCVTNQHFVFFFFFLWTIQCMDNTDEYMLMYSCGMLLLHTYDILF